MTKVDHEQVTHTRDFFNELASGWSDRYQVDPAMAARVNRFKASLASLPSHAHVLDFGCGSGIIAHSLLEEGYQVSATDVSEQMLAQCQKLDVENRIEWKQYAGDGALDFGDGVFDAVISSSVFEYVEDPAAVLSQINRTLKKGGLIRFTVPDLRDPIRIKETILLTLLKIPFLSSFIENGRWQEGATYLKLSKSRFTRKGWVEVCQRAGFSEVTCEAHCGPLMMISALKND